MDTLLYLEQQIADVRWRALETFERSSDLVAIDRDPYQALLAVLAGLSRQPDPASLSDFDRHLPPERRTGLKLFFGVVNYCFVQPYTRVEYPYTTAAGQLVRRATGFYTALAESGLAWEQVSAIEDVSLSQWHTLLQTGQESDLFQLDLRLERLKQFSAYLLQQGLAHTADLYTRYPDASSLLRLFIESGLFADDLLKRAQLTVFMLNPEYKELTGRDLAGMEYFTVMADYRLPQLFYNQGALKILDSALLEALHTHQVIPPESPAERALRAATIVLGQHLAANLHLTEAALDHLLWELSQVWVKTGRMRIPHMLVPTDKY